MRTPFATEPSTGRHPAVPLGLAVARLTATRPVAPVALAVLLLLVPALGLDGYWTRMIMLIAILSLLVSGLNIVLGYAGELAMGQVFLYAAGAYITGYLGVSHGITNVVVLFACAIAAAVVIGLVTGVPGLRLGGWSLAMLTFFLVIIIPNVLDVLREWTGGPNGLASPVPTFFGVEVAGTGLYLLIVGVAIVWFAVARNLIRSRHGNAFLVLKQSAVLAGTLGISTYRLKLLVYVVGAIPACLAGVLFAWLDGYIAPDTFTFALALSILAASVVGGSTSVYGAVAGAAILQFGQQAFTSFRDWQLIIFGAFLLVCGVLFAEGLSGLARRLLPRPAAPPLPATGSAELGTLPGAVLRTRALTKAFGGNTALDGVSIEARPGEVTALIGPNGSGKTTLLNLVCGFYKPTSGAVLLGDAEIGGLPPYRIARAGVGRTFQTPLIPKGMTTTAFVATGRFATHPVGVAAAVLRLPKFRRGYAEDDAEAGRLLRLLGLADVAGQEVGSLALGTRRLVEVARSLAARPAVFLFDEVGSGLDEEDQAGLERAIGMIRDAGGTVVLVEHNFPLVLRLADRVHVLSRGRLLASGTPAQIQRNPDVMAEYTGAGGGR